MTQSPREKAVEVVESYFREVFNGHNKIQDSYEWDKAKKCAIIAVDRELQTLTSVIAKAKQNEIEYINEIYSMIKEALAVKEEIEKL